LRELFIDKKYFIKILKNKFFLLLISLWVYLIINALFGLNYEVSLRRSIFFFRYIFLIFAFVYFFKDEQIRNKVINIYTLILLLVSFDIFFEFIFGKNILGFESPMKNERIVSFFEDELIVGSFLASFLFIIFGKFFNENKTILSAILFTIFAVSILITGERSVSIKVLISIVLIIFFVLENPKLKIYIALFSILLISLIFTNNNLNKRYLSFFSHFEKNFKKEDIYKSVLETKYLNQSLFSYEILKDNYFLGVGTKNYYSACSDLKNTSKKDIIQVNAVHCYTHPHQFYYELISEHGIIGSLIILYILLNLFSNKSNTFTKKDKRELFIFKIYFILSLVPIFPTGSFFSSLQLFQFFLNYAIYLAYYEAKYLNYKKNMI
tara:strand:- start:191 stop:1330 length:1140 start_codon:yes stop_codon:yes gene_type:complete